MNNDWTSGCGDVRALLNEYIDGELQGEELDTLEKHILACADCRAELQELGELKRLVNESALSSPGIYKGVMEQINSGRVKMHRPRRRFIPIGTLAALAAVLVFVALNRDVFNLFGAKTGMDNANELSGIINSETEQNQSGRAEENADDRMDSLLSLPEDAQFSSSVKAASPPPEAPDTIDSPAQQTAENEYGKESVETQEEFKIEIEMNAIAQKVKEESGFSIPTSRTYSVHLPDDYREEMLFEDISVIEDAGIYVLETSDEGLLRSRLDSISDLLYNSYAENNDSEKIAVIIIKG